ncbi:glycosyltransferase family 4 protein [Limobrevibacterium gyesilva]|uniref:Glycosyltransferase family 4 protein n=1 Tax=Limobrevibacterium gyesilva TaxID=2991712 RepID=A0AA41YQC5_9PROT|nr:glycosyltransferase family 4 protein [Limobrevibacterium gyesilva]MCW3476925.1 glycosyltransferase family 4 protein [Limobrevibacterium gyesilva]
MTLPGKVLLIANNFPPVRGGSAVVYDNLARYSGGKVVVVAPRISYVDGLPMIGWREHDRRVQYHVIRLKLLRTVLRPVPWRGMLGKLAFRASDLVMRVRLAATLLWLVRAERASVVCIGELLASSWVIDLFHRFTAVRTVVYVHGEEITTEDPYDPEHQRARRALLAADRIIVVSRFTLGAVRALLGPAADGKTSLIENGVDTARFRPAGKRPDLVELYRLQDRFVFVSVCRLLEKKGIDNAIRAFSRVVARHPDCRYLVVGTGPYEEALRTAAAQAGVADSVVFAGDVSDEDLVAHYCLGDVFVMPNRELANGDTEGFGLVFLEANSCGLPVVAGSDGGSRDAVQDGANGLVVDGKSVDEIAAAMLGLREDAALYDAIRRRALMIAAAADWKGKAEQFLKICTDPDPMRPAGMLAG